MSSCQHHSFQELLTKLCKLQSLPTLGKFPRSGKANGKCSQVCHSCVTNSTKRCLILSPSVPSHLVIFLLKCKCNEHMTPEHSHETMMFYVVFSNFLTSKSINQALFRSALLVLTWVRLASQSQPLVWPSVHLRPKGHIIASSRPLHGNTLTPEQIYVACMGNITG